MDNKYIKKFESFKDNRNTEQVNEELLGTLVNFLKGVFKKAQDKIKKLASFDDIKKYFQTDLFGTKSAESLFSGVLKEYNAKPQFNDQDCFDFISKLIDPDDSVLSTKSVQDFIVGFDDDKLKKEVQYELESVRNKTLVFFQYGAGSAKSFVVGKALPVPAIKPDLKSGKAIQRTPDGKGFVDQTHLPQLKKVISGLADDKKKMVVIDWVNNILIKKMVEFSNTITEEEVNKFTGVVETNNVDILGSYGVKEEKELIGKDIYYMMDKYDAKAPSKEFVGKGKVTEFEQTKGFSIETDKGTRFDKTVDKLLSKIDAEKLLGIKEGEEVMDYEKLNKIYGDKKEVIYLLPGIEKDKYDPEKKPDEQTEVVGVGQMISLNDQNDEKSVKFEKDGETIERSYGDIVGVVGDVNKSEEAKQAAEELAKIKDDPEKMKKVSSYAQFLQKGKEEDVNTIRDMIDDELKKL